MNRFYSLRVFLLACSLTCLLVLAEPQRPAYGQATSTPIPVPTLIFASRLLFVSTRDGNAEVYVSYADGSVQTNLTNNPANDIEPTWSPDGKQIAFVSDRDGNPEICVMDATGANQRCLTDNSTPDKKPDANRPFDSSPTWSPDGKAIAFASKRGAESDIYAMNSDGTGLVNVTRHVGVNAEPAWSPNLRQIAFSSNRNGNYDICIMDASGFNQRCLTNNRTAGRKPDKSRPDARYPAWAPDSLRLGFVSTKDRNLEVYSMNADGSQQQNITRRLAADDQPNWWQGGGLFAFVSNRDGRRTIYTMGSDGSAQKRLLVVPADKGENLYPAWQPLQPLPGATATETLTPTPTGTIFFTPEPTDTPTPTFIPRRVTFTPSPQPTLPPTAEIHESTSVPPPSLSANGSCNGTSVSFRILNLGGPMNAPYNYAINTAANGTIGSGQFQIPAGGATSVSASYITAVPSASLVIVNNDGNNVFSYEVPCP